MCEAGDDYEPDELDMLSMCLIEVCFLLLLYFDRRELTRGKVAITVARGFGKNKKQQETTLNGWINRFLKRIPYK